MALKVHIVCIDDQNDFTDPNGSLFVKGGDENVRRGARMIERLTDKISEIHVTMDSHHKVDISHPLWWLDDHGNKPGPITGVTLDDSDVFHFQSFITGVKTTGRTRVLSARDRTAKYIKALTTNGRYPHTIWPEHCLIGDEGHNLNPVLAAAVHGWEEKRYAVSNVVTKGSNPWTEHFSAVKAEVPDPEDPSTQINRALIEALEQADIVAWIGEALSHCLANTFRDTVASFSDPSYIKKMWLCTDASSSVPGFEKYGDDFIKEMKAKGMNLTTTTDFLA
jgi:nicotinamidase-related amidase